jgi:hypothetical protein
MLSGMALMSDEFTSSLTVLFSNKLITSLVVSRDYENNNILARMLDDYLWMPLDISIKRSLKRQFWNFYG